MNCPVTCTNCNMRTAVTKNGPDLCRGCLRGAIARATPVVRTCYAAKRRTEDEMQAPEVRQSNARDNAVRALEDGGQE